MNSRIRKSVHITNYYHKNSGGISTSFNNLMAAAERLQRQIRVIVPGEREAVEDVNAYCRLYYLPAEYSPIFDKRYRLILPWQYIPGDSLLRKILMDEMPDMIEVTDKYTLSMLGAMIRIGKFKQLERPMLVHFSAERMDDNVASFLSNSSWGNWLAKRVMSNYLLPTFDFHIANSSYTAEEFHSAIDGRGRNSLFINKCWRWLRATMIPPAERISVCPRGVNSEHFRPDRKSERVRAEMRERAGLPSDSTVLLYAGRISPEKNVELLVDMMAVLSRDRTRDFRLIVAGAGPKAEWLSEQAALNCGDKIIQVGHLDKEQLADYYANADVFVHPNPREPFGIAPLEAMASGAPTVAPNSGGILSYATDENCWLTKPDGTSFASAVRDVIDNPEISARKIDAAIATARANSRERSTDNLFATYDRMYEDFLSRRPLFTDTDRSKNFDFVKYLGI
ncbi:MAG: glycosyltransferase [Acidobacteriota bacterium]